MGCRLSKKEHLSNNLLTLCARRKRLAKSAVDRRKAFADAHCSYIRSLSGVSTAIGVFVARCSSSPSNSLFPETEESTTDIQNSVEIHQDSVQTSSDSCSDASGSSDGEGRSAVACEYFYGDIQPPLQSPGRKVGWDFFNLLDNPPLPVAVRRNKQGEAKSRKEKRKKSRSKLTVNNDEEISSRELLVSLKNLQKHFARAYESGSIVSRMLEMNKPHLQPVMEEIEENPSEFILPNAWNCSPSSQSSSSKSLISSSSKTSSTWTDSGGELFDGAGGMESGSHSFTLGRMYAWEKKLYEEVKIAEGTMKSYQQKCSQIRKGVEEDLEVSYLYNRILVSRKRVGSISEQLHKLRDEELQPQLVELLHGLMRSWKIMSESHKIQSKIMSEVKSFTCQSNGKLRHIATLELEKELRRWKSSFEDYLSTQKAYVSCLHGWLSKLADPADYHHLTLQNACEKWLASLERLPEKAVRYSMKGLVKGVHDLWVQQGEEEESGKKIDALMKEIDGEDGRVVLWKPAMVKLRGRARSSAGEDLSGKKKMLEAMRRRHHYCVLRTHEAGLDGLRMGFWSVFESMDEFCKACAKMYGDVVTFCGNSGQTAR